MLLTTVPRRRAERYTWRWWWQGDGTNEGNPGKPTSSCSSRPNCNRPQNKWQPKSFQVSVTKYKSLPPLWCVCDVYVWMYGKVTWTHKLQLVRTLVKLDSPDVAAVTDVAAEGPTSWRPHQLQLFTTYAKRVQLRALICRWSGGVFGARHLLRLYHSALQG